MCPYLTFRWLLWLSIYDWVKLRLTLPAFVRTLLYILQWLKAVGRWSVLNVVWPNPNCNNLIFVQTSCFFFIFVQVSYFLQWFDLRVWEFSVWLPQLEALVACAAVVIANNFYNCVSLWIYCSLIYGRNCKLCKVRNCICCRRSYASHTRGKQCPTIPYPPMPSVSSTMMCNKKLLVLSHVDCWPLLLLLSLHA